VTVYTRFRFIRQPSFALFFQLFSSEANFLHLKRKEHAEACSLDH
jgi:hypothetical protein